MSGLDAFIPAPNDPADLPAALRNFAQWVEQQKTAMEASVRAEVAKVNPDTIAANVLAQVPKTVAPFRVDVKYDMDTFRRKTSREFNMQIPEGAHSVRISARGGPYNLEEDKYLVGEWVQEWVDLSNARGLVLGCLLGAAHGGALLNEATVVDLRPPSWSSSFQQILIKAPPARTTNNSRDRANAFDTNGTQTLPVVSKIVFEWFKSVPDGI